MSLDTLLSIGFVLIVFGFPALISAWANGRGYFRPLALLAIGIVSLANVWVTSPATHSPSQWIEGLFRVIALILG